MREGAEVREEAELREKSDRIDRQICTAFNIKMSFDCFIENIYLNYCKVD